MNLTFLGATKTVTGSKYLLEAAGKRVLIDCGLFQGLKELRLRNWASLPIAAPEIDAVLLTHAHLDHSGYLPLLIKQGFAGKVYCTPGTRDLCSILLPDSGYLQEEEASYANKKSFSKHQPALPLYNQEEARQALSSLETRTFHQPFELFPGMKITFLPAGHILGAAMIAVETEGKKILFSGDLGRLADPIMYAPEHVREADYLLVESTYGDKQHDRHDPLDLLESVINRTSQRGGVVVVPAFAVGRAQALLYYIWRLKKLQRIPNFLPIFLNSPMAISASQFYCQNHQEHRLTLQECEEVCAVATCVETVEDSKRLNMLNGPAVIISASGMATGGRVLHHLKKYAPHGHNTILLVGHQAEGTRGQAIASGAKFVKMHGEMIPVRAEVVSIENLSAHADADEILTWLKHFAKAPKQTFIVHGEATASAALEQRIETELTWSCERPDYLQTYNI